MLSLVQLFSTPCTVAHQAPLSMGFSGQEYWSGLPFPSPVELPDAGIESTSSALAEGFFTSEHLGSPENRAMLFKHLIVICTVPVVPVGQRIWGAYNLSTLESWCGKRETSFKFISNCVCSETLGRSLICLNFHFLLCEEEIITLNSIGLVEINENHPNENKQAVDSELAVVREPATTICIRQRLQRRAGQWESFRVEESEGVSAVLGDDFNHEKVGGLAPSVAGLESIFGFPWLVLSWKRG